MNPTSRCFRNRPSAAVVAVSLWVGTVTLHGCGGDTPGPSGATPAPSAAAQPEVPPAPIADITAKLKQPLKNADDVGALEQALSRLRTWTQEHPQAPDFGDALVIRGLGDVIVAGARSALTGTPPRHLAGGRAASDVLLQLATALKDDPAEDAQRIREAALVLRALENDVKDVNLNLDAAMKLASETGPLGMAVRAAMLSRVETALNALATRPSELAIPHMVASGGRLLCPSCANLHHMSPDTVTHLILGKGRGDGLICDAAMVAGKDARNPSDELGALSLCPDLRPKSAQVEQVLMWSVNVVVTGLLRQGARLAALPLGDGSLKPALEHQLSRVRELLGKTWTLPVAAIASTLRPEDPNDGSWVVSLPDTGRGGLSTRRPSPGLFFLSPEGLSVGLRPQVVWSEGGITSPTVALGLPAGGRRILNHSDLTSPDAATRSVDAIASAIAEVGQAVGAKPEDLPEGTVPVDMVLDARVTTGSVAPVIEALSGLGASSVRFARPLTPGRMLPLLLRDANTEALQSAGLNAEHRMLMVVAGSYIDLWPPNAAGDKAPPELKGTPPAGLIPGYKGGKLRRLRMAIPRDHRGLLRAQVQRLKEGMKFLLQGVDTPPVGHVIAEPDSLAIDVIRVAQAYQDRPGKALQNPGSLWPETACGDETYAKANRQPSGCPVAPAVAFSRQPLPSGKGLTNQPPRAASSQNRACDEESIRKALKKRSGAMRYCHEEAKKETPGLRGSVTMRFVVGPDGHVQGEPGFSSSSLPDPTLRRCLVDNLKKIRFSRPGSGACSASWPLHFP